MIVWVPDLILQGLCGQLRRFTAVESLEARTQIYGHLLIIRLHFTLYIFILLLNFLLQLLIKLIMLRC